MTWFKYIQMPVMIYINARIEKVLDLLGSTVRDANLYAASSNISSTIIPCYLPNQATSIFCLARDKSISRITSNIYPSQSDFSQLATSNCCFLSKHEVLAIYVRTRKLIITNHEMMCGCQYDLIRCLVTAYYLILSMF